jgi:Zn-dependent peptidase ImmA (M78 family)
VALDPIRQRIAEHRAEDLIGRLHITEPDEIDVESIALLEGALVVDGGLTGAEARLTRSRSINFIRVQSHIREAGRRRFAIAHELGHLLLQMGPSQFTLCTEKELLPFYKQSMEELEASSFAASLLMPSRMFRAWCATALPSLRFVGDLAATFRVTLTAAAMRYVQCSPHRCCLVASRACKIRYHRATEDFGYFIQPRMELDHRTYAADHFCAKKVPEGIQSVAAEAWLEGPKIDKTKFIVEESIYMPFYDSVLTLLWVDKDIDQYVTGKDEYEAEQEASDARWSWNRYRR